MFKQSGFVPVDTWFELGINERFRWCPRRCGGWYPVYTGCLFFVEFWMKNHCKWISQHMINNNNNNNNNNDNNNNNNSAILSQTWTGVLKHTPEIFSKCLCCFITVKDLFWYILKCSAGENYPLLFRPYQYGDRFRVCQNLAENKTSFH